MKTPLLCLFLTISHLSIHAQTPDSTATAAVVDSLIRYNRELVDQGKFEEALKAIEEATEQAEKAFGKEHRLYAGCRYNQGRTYQIWWRNTEAIPFLLEARAIQERVIGKENLDYANTLQQLGIVHLRTETQLSEAKKFYVEARDIRKKILGEEHEDYAGSTAGLASVYACLYEFEQSLPLFYVALSIYEKKSGKENTRYLYAAMDLALTYLSLYQYEQAENIYLEIRRICSRLDGYNKEALFANNARGLSYIYFDLGQYEQAEKYLSESIAGQEKTIGEDHLYVLADKAFLGVVMAKLGRHKEGKNLALEALRRIEKTESKISSNYYSAVYNVNWINYLEQHFDTTLVQDAEQYLAQLNAEERATNFTGLHHLAIHYTIGGDFEKAEALFKESIQYQEMAFDSNHVSLTRAWMHLGNLYRLQGRFEDAEQVLLKARNIWQQYFKPQHDDFIFNENTLAWLYAQWGREEEADTAFAEIGRLRRELALRGVRYLSESELGRYVQAYLNQNDQLCYRAAKRAGRGAVLTGEVWNNALFYKGLLLDNRNLLQRIMAAAPDSIRSLHDQWRGYLRRLNVAYTQATSPDAARIETLEQKANAIEKTLTQALAGFEQMNRQATWQEVRQSLRANEAAVEFVHYRSFAPTGKGVDSTFYAALLLRPGYEHPRWIGLFEERQLDSLLLTAGKRRADYVNHLYDFADRGLKPLGRPRKMLYELVWQPLEPFLDGADTVYFSLSGLLHRINLPAIACSPDSVVADRYKLTGIGSTRRLTRLPETPEPASNYAALFGGIRYEADTTAILSANAELDSVSYSARGLLDFGYTDSTLRNDAWSYLPFAEKEVRAIEILVKNANIRVETRKGFAATEESFKTLGQGKASPRILHVATHGFFFPDPKIPNRLRDAVEAEATFKLSDHPMIRSGLLMAGANGAWQNGQPLKPGLEDGILTAYEISQMNLSNTELVVLSACETGLGDIQGNEGVYGLQRAFKIAGAKYLIMSLWQVPDQETSIFMTSFYRHWLEGQTSIPGAFRATQKEMRERFINPYQWAGFVLVE